MKITGAFCLGMSICAWGATATADENTVALFFRAYNSGDARERTALEAILEATANGASWANRWVYGIRNEPPLFCIPKGGGNDTGAVLAAAIRLDLAKHPQVKDADIGEAVLLDLQARYPCRKPEK
jgi:hypothetical protein